VANEVQRLLALKSYSFLLENESLAKDLDDTLCRLTNMASRVFNCAIGLVALIDLGRVLVVKATKGFPEEAMVQRRGSSVCGHSILENSGLLVVPDMSKDDRFKHLPPVVSLGLNFYAGAAISSPEGYHLGAFVIADTKPRPEGLSPEQEESLRDMAKLTADSFTQHKNALEVQQQLQVASCQLACACHDLTTPLSAIQLSVSLIRGDKAFRDSLSDPQRECLTTIGSCADAMVAVCESLRRRGRSYGESAPRPFCLCPSSWDENEATAKCAVLDGEQVWDTVDFVDKIQQGLAALPAKGAVTVSLDPSVPAKLAAKEFELFRLVYKLLSHACDQARSGSICLTISLKKPTSECGRPDLFFECKVCCCTKDSRESLVPHGEILKNQVDEANPWKMDWQSCLDSFP
jgi:hypothetical protein